MRRDRNRGLGEEWGKGDGGDGESDKKREKKERRVKIEADRHFRQ